MYWAHNNATSPQIEAVLNKENVTLYDLMDEEDILQECKSQNKKLIDFLVRPDIMEELVTLTTVEPSSEVDEKTRYKYPNIACELLTSDVPALNLRLANDGVLLGKLYYFLESDPPLNSLLASYFSKTLSMLVSQKTVQVLEFLKSKENFVSLLVKHLGTSAIMDLMLKLITNVEGVEIKQNILNWLDSEHIVQSLIELLSPSVDSDRQCNAAQLLSDIIAKSRDSTVNANERSNSDPIVATLEASDTITLLLNNILGPDKTETSIVGGIQVLLALLNFNKNSPISNSNYEQVEVAAEREHREKVIQNVNTAIIERLKDFHDILLNPPKKAPIQTTIGLLDPPFGNTRLQVTRLLAALLLYCNHTMDIKNEISKLGTINVLLDLFFKYTWNNFLHTQVQNCISYALIPTTTQQSLSLTASSSPSSPPPPPPPSSSSVSSFKIEDSATETTTTDNIIITTNTTYDNNTSSGNNVMYEHIFVQCRLLGRILEAWDDNEQKQSQTKGVRQGYMGHLINIANNVAEQWDKTSLGEFITENINSETVESWKKFVDGPLAEVNKKHQDVLGGIHPSNTLSSDNQDEFREVPFPSGSLLQTTYTDFNRSQFIEVYEYNNDEEEMFDRVCAETMNSFDNVDDEDDIWEPGSTTITSNLDDKQQSPPPLCGDWQQQRRNSDADDPMANKLDGTIVDPWKTDVENPNENSVVPIAESDPWGSNPNSDDTTNRCLGSSDGGDTIGTNTIDEGWANFETFNNFDTATFNGIPSSIIDDTNTTTSNFFGTFSPQFAFTEKSSSDSSSSTSSTSSAPNLYDDKQSDDNANISNCNPNSNESSSSSSIDNFHTCLSNALKTAAATTSPLPSTDNVILPTISNDLSKVINTTTVEAHSTDSSNAVVVQETQSSTIPTDKQNAESSTIPVATVLVAEADKAISDESV